MTYGVLYWAGERYLSSQIPVSSHLNEFSIAMFTLVWNKPNLLNWGLQLIMLWLCTKRKANTIVRPYFTFMWCNIIVSSGVSRGVFWLPGNPPPGHDFFYSGGWHRYWHRPSPAIYICDFWKPPLRPTLDTPLVSVWCSTVTGICIENELWKANFSGRNRVYSVQLSKWATCTMC